MTHSTRSARSASSTAPPIGVGFLGAGPVVQAIHLPSLARLPATFAVRHVMDVDARIAATVAARAGARHSTSTDELLADPQVEVVAICSPHQFHAEQVIAACRAGAKVVFCERDTSTQLPAGQGRMDIWGIIAATRSLEVGVLEFDDYAGDIFAGVAASLRYLEAGPTAGYEHGAEDGDR